MMQSRKYLWPMLVLASLALSGVLFWIVWDRDRLLKTGREIVLPVIPIDPRDIFRGEYVTLGYDISRIQKSALSTNAQPALAFDDIQTGQVIYVTLHQSGDGSWAPVGFGLSYPADVASGDVVVKGHVWGRWETPEPTDASRSMSNLGVRYGIESYFVPEGTGKALEEGVRDKKIQAIVAIGSDGTAALKGLVVDGQRHEDPPLL